MITRLPNVGSQYLIGFMDANKDYFNGAKTYKVTLPPNIPAKNFWSFTVYDNQTRSMLRTPQRFPRAGSQSYPTPAAVANSDGSTTIYFAPSKPEHVSRGWLRSARPLVFYPQIEFHGELKAPISRLFIWEKGTAPGSATASRRHPGGASPRCSRLPAEYLPAAYPA